MQLKQQLHRLIVFKENAIFTSIPAHKHTQKTQTLPLKAWSVIERQHQKTAHNYTHTTEYIKI